MEADEREFFEKHCRHAIPPQGPAPARFSSIERSLQPEAYGACHPVQFGDWQASLHSRSIGPGVDGQLVEMARREPAGARGLQCQNCHMPDRRHLWRGIHDADMVRAELVDAQGQPVAGSVEERVIARQVPLDLSREIADTRIPPGGRFTLDYARRLEAVGLKLRVTVAVLPADFYTRSFEALLAAGAGAGEAQIREALEATRRSAYTLCVKELPLT